jgi:hypothetical protein
VEEAGLCMLRQMLYVHGGICELHYLMKMYTVSSSFKRIVHNAIDGYLNAVGLIRTFAHKSSLLSDFSDKCEDIAPIQLLNVPF